METKYKLKVDARKFFTKEYSRHIEPIRFWESVNIHINLLDEVDTVYVDYGHESVLESGTKTSSLSGWNKDFADFRFAIKFPEMKHDQYEKVKIHELMDEFQKVANRYFKGN